MAGNCKVNNYTYDELDNYIKQAPAYKRDSTLKDAIEYLDVLMENLGVVEIDDETSGYGFKDKIIFPERVTKWLDKFKKFKGKFQEGNNNNVIRSGGVIVHTMMQHFMAEKTGIRTKINQEELKLAQKYMNKNHIKVLKEAVDSIYDDIQKTQKGIDPKGEVQIRLEQPVGDPKKGRAGSIDVLAVFSNKKGMIYDYKTAVPSVGRNFVIDKQLIYPAKQDQYKLQLSEYKRILEDVVGIEIIGGRIVPIAVSYKSDSKGQYTGEIMKVQAGTKSSEFLRQIAVVKESTGYEELDKLISKKRNLITILENRASTLYSKGEREKADKLYERRNVVRRNIQDILVDKNILNIGIEALLVSKEIIEHDEDDTLKDLSFEELDSYQSQLKVYAHIMRATENFMKDIKGVEEKKKIRSVRRDISASVAEAEAKIFLERERQTMEGMDPRHKTESGRKLLSLKRLGPIQSLFTRLSDLKHPIFIRFRDVVDRANMKTRRALETIFGQINEKFEAVRDTGMSRKEINEAIVDPETQNLYSKLDEKFYEEMKEARERKDSDKMKQLYQIIGGEKEYRKEYKRRLQEKERYYRAENNNLRDFKASDGSVIKEASEYRNNYEKQLRQWKRTNNLLVSKESWLAPENRFYIEPKPSTYKKYESKAYSKISQNKALKEFYDFYIEKNQEFRELMGLRRYELPDELIANIRQSALEKLINNKGSIKIGSSLGELFDSLNVREEDYYFGEKDNVTGEIKKKIPVPFLNAFTNDDGSLKQGQKSFDLTRNLFIMAKVAHNFNNMSKIEGETNALMEVLAEAPAQETTTTGEIVEGDAKIGINSEEYDTLRAHVDFHLYGVSERIKGKTFTPFGVRVNSTKAIKKMRNYVAKKQLSFAINPAIAQYFHGKVGVLIESHKGTIFNGKQSAEAQAEQITHPKMYQRIGEYFDVHAESILTKMTYRISKEYSKIADDRTLFSGYRWGSEAIDNTIMGAMMRNYGIDENGNVKRLKYLQGEDKRNLMDRFDKKLYLETGEIKFDGLSDDNIIQFKRAVHKAGIKVKGDVSEEDKSKYQYNVYLSSMMQYKHWMPGIIKERFGGIGYDQDLDVVDYGRYKAVMDEFMYEEGMRVSGYIGKVIIPRMLGLSMDLVTFGLTKNYARESDMKLERARIQFDKYLDRNPQDKDVVTFEMFLEAKQGAIRAALTEVRASLMFLSATLWLGMEGEGDEPKYKEYGWAGRQLYKILNRTKSEIIFSLNPSEFITIATSNPIPVTGLILDAAKVLGNTVDETMDLATGRVDKNDRTPPLYYLSRWAIGVNQGRQVFDWWYEEDMNKKR